jgi:regulator of protease activity HflC (stomatin/prohibitin superfamily)
MPFIAVALIVAVLLLVFFASAIRVVQEYERGVIFRLGRCIGAKGPGIFFLVPLIDKMIKVNLQIVAVPVESQAVITKDNVTTTVDAVAYFQVVDPAASVVKILNWYLSAQLVAQTSLRSIVGRHELDQLLSDRERMDAELQVALDTQTEAWGVKVHRVEIRDVGLPEQMQRAMARQAEAERERRAKIIAADGERQASEQLAKAARTLAMSPGALQLRQLQTMAEISTENSSTIIFPIPVELLDMAARLGTPLAPTSSADPSALDAMILDDGPTDPD